MKLKCTKGSISCDGVLAECGDVFEVGDEAGKGLIESRFAVEIIDEPTEEEIDESTGEIVPESDEKPINKGKRGKK